LVQLDLADAIDLAAGDRAEAAARYLVRNDHSHRYVDGLLARRDLVPGYLDENTDQLYLRLFVAARRYLHGERTHLFW
jgi:hypothetical protein